MNRDLDEALVRDFPNLYRDRYGDPRDTCMARGFEIGVGWEPIVRSLSAKLEVLVAGTDACAAEVREKSGMLRFAMSGTSRDNVRARQLVVDAIRASCTTCERCGAAGKRHHGRDWALALCDDCAERRNQRRRW